MCMMREVRFEEKNIYVCELLCIFIVVIMVIVLYLFKIEKFENF